MEVFASLESLFGPLYGVAVFVLVCLGVCSLAALVFVYKNAATFISDTANYFSSTYPVATEVWGAIFNKVWEFEINLLLGPLVYSLLLWFFGCLFSGTFYWDTGLWGLLFCACVLLKFIGAIFRFTGKYFGLQGYVALAVLAAMEGQFWLLDVSGNETVISESERGSIRETIFLLWFLLGGWYRPVRLSGEYYRKWRSEKRGEAK